MGFEACRAQGVGARSGIEAFSDRGRLLSETCHCSCELGFTILEVNARCRHFRSREMLTVVTTTKQTQNLSLASTYMNP